MGVDVADLAIDVFHRLLHAANGAFTAGRHHIGAVRGCAEAHQLGQDVGSASFRMLQGFQYQDAAAARDDETVPIPIVGAGGFSGGVVVFGGERTHGVEHQAQRPVDVFTATGKHHVLAAQGNHIGGMANGMGAGGAG